ncbi:hypothetical protein [Tunturiibacter gelidiferens]|uniref:hypothetical protein n=1 Tax=Tunturiibacter gelidiferens TaxID=3069689 RepID=UPI003D9B3719
MKTWIGLTVIATSLSVFGQAPKATAPVAPHRSSTHAEPSTQIGSPLPMEVSTSVEPHYRGMNASAIFDVLHRNIGVIKASEYETKTQFDARLQRIMSLPLFDGHKVGDQYTFALGGAWAGERSFSSEGGDPLSYLRGAIQTSYNSESQILTVTLPIVTGMASGMYDMAFGWGYDVRTVGHHVGQNAFGVKMAVTDSVIHEQTLDFNDADIAWLESHCEQESARSDVKCKVPVSAARARAMDGSIRVALGSTLKEPYTAEDSGTQKATIDSPYENHEVRHGLFISPNQLVIYDGRTGEVVAQYIK